jgi:pimeloyl-ACP methyl ester carboxylesterase
VLSDNGWSVVMYDYPGHGLSTGAPSLERLPDVLETVLDWSLSRTGRHEATLLGISIGTLPVVSVAARRPETVNALILDSPLSLAEELQRLDPFLAAYSQPAVRVLPAELKSEQRIRDVTQPALFLLHGADYLAPPALAQVLIERIQGPATVFEFEGLPHAQGIYFDTEHYIAQVESFLTTVWAGATP